jgi:hypothetical protein
MVSIVEKLKVLGLRSEVAIASKPLGSEESSIIGIIEALHDSITPGFSYGDKDHFYPKQKTNSEDNAEGTGVTIASAETELVVDLKKVGHTHGLPTADQAQSRGLVVFSSLRMQEDPVAVKIHDVERIETSIVFDVPRPEEVRLMDLIDPEGFSEIRVFHSFGGIRSFF